MTALKFAASACLAGVKCRYDGEDKKLKKIYLLVKKGKGLPFCPEMLGGLPTPRYASRIKYDSGKKLVISSEGEDLSKFFLKGAELSSGILKRFKISFVYLKKKSPSCGFGLEKRQQQRTGVTSTLLFKRGMKIYPV